MFENIIKIPYTTSPDMKKYEGPIINDNPLEFYLEAKQVELELIPGIVYESDIAIEKGLIKEVANALKLTSKINDITSLGLSIQEDIAIFYQGKLEAYFIAFPSGWNPSDKGGKTLKELHGPVADGEELRHMSDKITKLLSAKYSYHRYVWNVVPTGMLSMHPNYGIYHEDTGVEYATEKDLWFRLEHQTSLPLIPEQSFAFFINVDVLPFSTLYLNDKYLILDSINSMTNSILNYKNLNTVKQILNREIIIPK